MFTAVNAGKHVKRQDRSPPVEEQVSCPETGEGAKAWWDIRKNILKNPGKSFKNYDVCANAVPSHTYVKSFL